jgi:hypothetical protein
MKRVLLFSVLLASMGCATGATGPGRLNPDLIRVAASAEGVRKIELHSDQSGALGKMSVYHQDANRIPESVRKLAETLFPGSKSLSFETEHYADAGLVYEVEVESQDGRHCEVSATADAKHRYTECRLSQDALPAAVSKKLETTLPGATVEELEVLKGPSIGGGEEYRAELKVGSVVHYLRLSPGGELLRHGILVPAKIEVPHP